MTQKGYDLILTFAFILLGGSSSQAQTTGLNGEFEIANWEKSDIADGTTGMTGITESQAEFTYTVDRGNPGPGVPVRFADFTLASPINAHISFDWEFTGNHRWFEAYEQFFVLVNGEEILNPLPETKSSGAFTHSGFEETFSVGAGESFGFRIGGRNFDSSSQLNGLLRITNFQVEELAGLPIELILSRSEDTPGTWDFEWTSKEGKSYDVLSSTDLSIPMEDWETWETDVLSAGARTRLETVEVENDKRFFVVVEKSAP